MAKLPVFFTASTKAIAEKAIQRGILKYPGLCYIEDGNVIAWMTEDNEIRYTKGDKQITDVKFSGSNLQFFNEKKLLFSYDLSMTDEDKDHIVDEVKRQIGLDSYIKSSELSTILDNIIGNLEDTSNTNYNAGNNSATTVYLPVQEGTIITSATIGSQSVPSKIDVYL